MSNNSTKYEVLIKQYLRSILDISEQQGISAQIIFALLAVRSLRNHFHQTHKILGPKKLSRYQCKLITQRSGLVLKNITTQHKNAFDEKLKDVNK